MGEQRYKNVAADTFSVPNVAVEAKDMFKVVAETIVSPSKAGKKQSKGKGKAKRNSRHMIRSVHAQSLCARVCVRVCVHVSARRCWRRACVCNKCVSEHMRTCSCCCTYARYVCMRKYTCIRAHMKPSSSRTMLYFRNWVCVQHC